MSRDLAPADLFDGYSENLDLSPLGEEEESTPIATTTNSFDGDVVFSLNVIIFLMSFIFMGFIFNTFQK